MKETLKMRSKDPGLMKTMVDPRNSRNEALERKICHYFNSTPPSIPSPTLHVTGQVGPLSLER
jgi:hypothetical protein